MIAIPPGATIKDLMEDRGMSRDELAARSGLSKKQVDELLDGDAPLTFDMMARLEGIFGLSRYFWNALDERYREKLAVIEAEEKELAQ